jgi:sec-independent protein translocase protein TatB
MPGSPEIAVIFLLALILFGPDKLPELARSISKGVRELRKVANEFRSQMRLDD